MRKTSSLANRSAALAGALMLLAGPALPARAENPSGTNGSAPSESAAAPLQRMDQRASTRKICVRDIITGSRIVRQVCKSEAEWRASGEVPGSDRLAR
jgi:hypothetical protein